MERSDVNEIVHDTLITERGITAPPAAVWAAYADPAKRARWSVPAGESMVFDEADFTESGHDRYRCGPLETLPFHAHVHYITIVPRALIVYTETVRAQGRPLATGVIIWDFEAAPTGTNVTITSHIVSFVGHGMIDGNRHGHLKALAQLDDFLAAGPGR